MQASKVPKQLRRALIQSLVWTRSKLAATASEGPAECFVTWPPIGSPDEYRSLITRLHWYLPAASEQPVVYVPVRRAFDVPAGLPALPAEGLAAPTSPKAEIRIVSGLRNVPDSAILLLWRFLSTSSLRAAFWLKNVFAIDHDFFLATEQFEWMKVFERCTGTKAAAQMEGSRRVFRRLLNQVAGMDEVNVFGNGPGLQQVYSANVSDAANIICNAAVQSTSLVDYLRPVVLALVNPLYFGPSLLGREFMEAVVQCAKRHGTFVLVPAGYAYYLLKANYAILEPYLIGFEMVRKAVLPSAARPAVTISRNVVSCLMLPVAAAMQPRRIGVWGCDGRKPGEQRYWSYMTGLEPKLDSAARAHPSYFRDRILKPAFFDEAYADHCEYMETIVQRIEAAGVPVLCRSASRIPALRNRTEAAAVSGLVAGGY